MIPHITRFQTLCNIWVMLLSARLCRPTNIPQRTFSIWSGEYQPTLLIQKVQNGLNGKRIFCGIAHNDWVTKCSVLYALCENRATAALGIARAAAARYLIFFAGRSFPP